MSVMFLILNLCMERVGFKAHHWNDMSFQQNIWWVVFSISLYDRLIGWLCRISRSLAGSLPHATTCNHALSASGISMG